MCANAKCKDIMKVTTLGGSQPGLTSLPQKMYYIIQKNNKLTPGKTSLLHSLHLKKIESIKKDSLQLFHHFLKRHQQKFLADVSELCFKKISFSIFFLTHYPT